MYSQAGMGAAALVPAEGIPPIGVELIQQPAEPGVIVVEARQQAIAQTLAPVHIAPGAESRRAIRLGRCLRRAGIAVPSPRHALDLPVSAANQVGDHVLHLATPSRRWAGPSAPASGSRPGR